VLHASLIDTHLRKSKPAPYATLFPIPEHIKSGAPPILLALQGQRTNHSSALSQTNPSLSTHSSLIYWNLTHPFPRLTPQSAQSFSCCHSPRQHITYLLRLPPRNTCSPYPALHQRINTYDPYQLLRFRCELFNRPFRISSILPASLFNCAAASLIPTRLIVVYVPSTSNPYKQTTPQLLNFSNSAQTTTEMPASAASAFNPRQRLSIFTNSTLGHDVSAAFKASSSLNSRSSDANETPAPPPSPVDFSFPSTPADSRRGSSN
jgi:hypothetical protein